MERSLTINFIGKDKSLKSTATEGERSLGKFAQSVQSAAKGTQLFVDEQGRLKNAQGQFVDATKLSAKELDKLRQSLQENGQNVAAFDKNLKEAKTNLLAFAGVAGGVGASVAGLFGRGTQEFLAFSGNIKQAGVVSNASEADLKALSDEVERLGIVTSKAPAEIAQTAVSLSRAGFAATETIDALEGVTRASEATGESLFIVGDIISKTVRTFGLTADEAGRIGDVLVATANNTNTTISSIGESLAFVGAQAKGANQPVEDVAILIGLLGDAGIQGSSAGTQLGAALDKLKAASAGLNSEYSDLVRGNEKAVKAFELIKTEVRNTDGTMKSLLEILPSLKTNLSNLDQADQDLVSKALFGTQGGRAIQTLLNATDERVAQVSQTIKEAEGQATQSGEAMLSGLGGALSLLQGSVGATLIKFGEFTAIGLEPLVRGAIAVLNGFLALPGPIQAVIVGTTALTGVLAAAIAAYITYNSLQVADKAAKIAGAGATAIKTAAEKAHVVATVASSTANAVMNASITKQSVLLGLNTVAEKGAIAAKTAYAAVTGTAAKAVRGFTINLVGLAAKAAIATAAIYAITQIFTRSTAGSQYRKDLDEAIGGLEKTRAELDDTGSLLKDVGTEFSDFFDNIKEKGFVDALTIAFVDLQSALGLTADATSRFGEAWSPATKAQLEARAVQVATEEAFRRLGGSVQETSDLLAKYGQALPDGRQLSGAELRAFTKAIADQSKALQEEIEILEKSKGQSQENDAQLQNEINTRQRLIRVLKAREAAQTGETESVEQATDAVRELSTVLDELSGKYDDLEEKAAIAVDEQLGDIAAREAEGLISQAQAEQEKLAVEQEALTNSISRNEELLRTLESQRSQREGEDLEQLEDEILNVQKEIAQEERKLAEDRAAARRDEAKEAERQLKEEAKRQEAILKEAAEKRAELLQQAQEDEAQVRQDAFDDSQRTQADEFSDSQDTAKRNADEIARAADTAFNQQQQALEENFEAEQRSQTERFEAKLRTAERTFTTEQEARQEAFNKRQQEAQKAFADSQREQSKAFNDQQSAVREQAEGRFAQQRLEIERRLQLEDASSPEERDRLRQQFADEDAEAQRREAAFASVVAAEKAFEEQQQAQRIAFEEQQQAKQAAFAEQQQAKQAEFEAQQQAIADERELQKAALKAAFDEKQRLAVEAFEQRLEAQKLAYEEEKRAREIEFQLAQQNREREFEAQQREAERAFRDAERQKDRDNAIAIQNILDSATATPTQSLRSGGITQGGVVQVHADEFILPPRGTRVVSQQESRRLVQEYLIQNPLVAPQRSQSDAVTAVLDNSGVAEKLDVLINAVRQQRRPMLKTGGDVYNISGQANPGASAQQIALDNLRSLVRLNR